MSKTIFIRWQKQKFVKWKSTTTNCNTKIRNDFILPVQYYNILYIGAKLFNVLPPDFKQAKRKKISRKSYNCGYQNTPTWTTTTSIQEHLIRDAL